MPECNDAILVTGWIALETTALLARRKKEELMKRLPSDLIRTAESFAEGRFLDKLSAAKVREILGMDKIPGSGCDADGISDSGRGREMQGGIEVTEVLEGGIFHALWDMAEKEHRGMDIDLCRIPIRQETVELCEVFDLNPYQARSGGCCLITASNGAPVLERLKAAGVPVSYIGIVTKGPARLLRHQEDIRYLDKPRYQDEIRKIR